MPLYEFQCRECEATFEVRLEWKAPFPPCPSCGSAEVRKVLQAPALVFKGSGWHVNDYAKSGARTNGHNKPSSDSNGSSSSTSSSSSSSDSSSSTSSTSSSTSSNGSGATSSKPDK